MHQGTTIAPVLLAGVCALYSLGCSPTLENAGKAVGSGVVPSAIESSLTTFEEERTRQRVLALMNSPEMQKTIETLAKDVTRGATEAMGSDEMAKRSSELASNIAATATRVAMDAAMSEIASPANEKRIAEVMSVATAAATRSAIQAMADELPRSLGPAIAEMVRRDITPSVRGLASDSETRSAVGTIAFEASRQAVLGSNEALAELEQKHHKQGLLAHLSGVFSEGGVLVAVLMTLALGAFVVLFAAFLSTRSKLKHARLVERVEDDVLDRPETEDSGMKPLRVARKAH
jgi:hypothetical protein